jgi:hypothetical protein
VPSTEGKQTSRETRLFDPVECNNDVPDGWIPHCHTCGTPPIITIL